MHYDGLVRSLVVAHLWPYTVMSFQKMLILYRNVFFLAQRKYLIYVGNIFRFVTLLQIY